MMSSTDFSPVDNIFWKLFKVMASHNNLLSDYIRVRPIVKWKMSETKKLISLSLRNLSWKHVYMYLRYNVEKSRVK